MHTASSNARKSSRGSAVCHVAVLVCCLPCCCFLVSKHDTIKSTQHKPEQGQPTRAARCVVEDQDAGGAAGGDCQAQPPRSVCVHRLRMMINDDVLRCREFWASGHEA